MPVVPYQQWRKTIARLQNLDKLARTVKDITRRVDLSDSTEDLTEHE
jgi:hypothetical protein